MPELCRFEGIIIQMYFETGTRHLAHFHVRFGNHRASFGIDPIQVLAGELPTRQRRLVEAWAELHERELKTNWELLQAHQPARRIDPLR
jgi:hypothetical protein